MPTQFYNSPDRGPAVLSGGARLGKYELVRLLGAGGMGTVYEAVHTEIGKRVAIKVLAPAVAAKPEARARFLREAQLTSKVRHPHAVDVTDMGTEGDQTFLVMELLDGEDLATRLGREPQLALTDLVDIMLPVCSAVAAAHAASVIHRDLKPQNIFLARSASGLVAKVLDFGISKAQDAAQMDALTGSDAIIGTPYYLAPEQVTDSRSASPASDQYAIGVVLYECLTGVRPFQADSLYGVLHAIIEGAPARPRERRPDLDASFEAVVLRAMNVARPARFASVTALAQAMWPFASERGRMVWREAYGSSRPGVEPPRPARSSNETAIDDAVRTPRWPARDAQSPRPPAATPPPSVASVPFGASSAFVASAPSVANGSTTAPLVRRSRAPLAIGVALVAALGGGVGWFATGGARKGDTGPSAAVEAPTAKPTPPVAPPSVAPPPPEHAAAPAPSPPPAPPVPAPTPPAAARAHSHRRISPRSSAATPAPPVESPRAGANNAPLIE